MAMVESFSWLDLLDLLMVASAGTGVLFSLKEDSRDDTSPSSCWTLLISEGSSTSWEARQQWGLRNDEEG